MTPSTAAEPDTLADVVRVLGDIPLHRILWHPFPGTATEADQLRLVDGEPKLLAELVDGVLVLKAIDRDVLTACAPDVVTLADVVERLGDVPLDRIVWTPRPGTATEDDQVRLVDGEPKRLVELVDGILVEKPMGYREGLLAAWIGTCLNNFVVPRRMGVVGGADAIMRVAAGTNRLPDVSFVAWASLPERGAHRRAVARFAPDLAVEVVSESNTRREIARKRGEYFAAGTRLVWVVDPRSETVAVFADPSNPDAHTVLAAAQTLDGGTVLPGFTLAVADIFGYLNEPDDLPPADALDLPPTEGVSPPLA